jgi:hypothetical protein
MERLRAVAPRGGAPAEACGALLEALGVARGGGDDVCVLALDVV